MTIKDDIGAEGYAKYQQRLAAKKAGTQTNPTNTAIPKPDIGGGDWINTRPTRATVLSGEKPIEKLPPTATPAPATPAAPTATPAPAQPEIAAPSVFDMNESQLRDYVNKTTQEQIQPALDIYHQTYGGLENDYNARIAQLEAQKGTVMQPYQDLAQQQQLQNQEMYDAAAAQKAQEASRAVEDTSRRFGMQGFGRSTIHSDEQYILQQQAQNIQQELTRAKLLENSRINAELMGATQQQLGSLDDQIMAQKEKVAGLKSGMAESEANLKLSALEKGNTSVAGIMEQQLAKQAADDEQLANYLKSQGLTKNPLTGEYVEDIVARADLLKTQAEIAKAEAETQNLLNPQQEIAVNPVTGDYYDKNTGRVVGNAFTGIMGGSSSGGGFTGGSVITADNSTVKNALALPGKSRVTPSFGEGRKECGEAYNDYTQGGGRAGSTYSSKMALVTKRDNPEVGNGLILPLNAYYKDKNGNSVHAGHIETVISKDPTTGKVKTVSYNRDGKGGQTIQEYSIAELQSKYGNNWGFSDSSFKPQYAQALSQMSVQVQPQTPGGAGVGATFNDYLQQAIASGMPGKQAMDYASEQVKADADKARGANSESLDQSQALATRYKPLQDEVRTLEQGFSVTRGFNENTTNPYDDQALIFSFMKVLDPGSVVREGEYSTAQRNTSMLNSLAAGWQQAANGTGTLTPDQRKNILSTMRNIYSTKRGAYDQELEAAKNVGLTYGIDPSLYLTVPSATPVQQTVNRGDVMGSVGGNFLQYLFQ